MLISIIIVDKNPIKFYGGLNYFFFVHPLSTYKQTSALFNVRMNFHANCHRSSQRGLIATHARCLVEFSRGHGGISWRRPSIGHNPPSSPVDRRYISSRSVIKCHVILEYCKIYRPQTTRIHLGFDWRKVEYWDLWLLKEFGEALGDF